MPVASARVAQVVFSFSTRPPPIYYFMWFEQGLFIHVGSILRTFCDVRGHPQAEFGRKQVIVGSKAEHWSTPQLRRDSMQRSVACSVHGAGGTRRSRASRAAGSRQQGWRRGTKQWAAHAAQRRRARDAGLLMVSVRRGQNRTISPRVCVLSRGVIKL